MELTQPYSNKIMYLQVLLLVLGIEGFQLISNIPEAIGVLNSRIVSIPYRFVYFVICILTLLHFRWEIKFNRLFLPVFLFIFLYFIRSFYDTIFKFSEVASIAVEFWLFAFIIGFFPMLPFLYKMNLKTIEFSKKALFVITTIINIISFKSNYFAIADEKMGARLYGNELINPITYGQSGVVLVILCLTLFQDPKFKLKIILLPILAIALMNVALAGSRGPMIELTLTFLLFIIFNFKKIGSFKISVLIISLIGAAFYFSNYIVFFNTAIDRLSETGLNKGSESEQRYYLFKDAIEQFFNNPIFGYQAIGVYPHNLIFEAFLSLGILGGLLFIYIIVISIYFSISLIKTSTTNWIGLIFMMYIISTFVSGALWNSFEFWSLLALSFTLYKNKKLYLNFAKK